MKVMGRVLRSEVAAITSDDFSSITRNKSKESVKNFAHIVNTIISELKSKAPTLLSILQSCLKTRKRQQENSDAIVTVIASILCKHRRPSACIIQRIISLLLYSGHSSKQVC